MTAWIAAGLAAAAVWLLAGRPPRSRLRALLLPPERERETAGMDLRATWIAGAAAAAGIVMLVGGVLGVLGGVTALILVPRALGRLESRAVRQRREDLERQAPLLADLVGALLSSGATVRDALDAGSEAVGSPTVQVVGPVVAAIDLGADPATAWNGVGVCDAHQSIVDALGRAHRSGAPAALLLMRAADDLRRDRRRTVEVAARSAGVRAVVPLAACFLPAFLLMGVVPVVASLASGLISA